MFPAEAGTPGINDLHEPLTSGCATAAYAALAAQTGQTPNFAPNSATGWLKPPGDEFIQPPSGPGPVKADPSHRLYGPAYKGVEIPR